MLHKKDQPQLQQFTVFLRTFVYVMPFAPLLQRKAHGHPASKKLSPSTNLSPQAPGPGFLHSAQMMGFGGVGDVKHLTLGLHSQTSAFELSSSGTNTNRGGHTPVKFYLQKQAMVHRP